MTASVALGEIADINPRLESKLRPESLVSFVGMSDLSDELAITNVVSTRQYSEVSKGFTPFLNGDLLLAKITPCFENGKIGRARILHKHGFGSTEFHVIRPNENVDRSYLLHMLRHPYVRSLGELRMTGSAGQRRVPAAFVEQLKVPLPSLNEQRRIAAILDKADNVRTKRRQALAQGFHRTCSEGRV